MGGLLVKYVTLAWKTLSLNKVVGVSQHICLKPRHLGRENPPSMNLALDLRFFPHVVWISSQSNDICALALGHLWSFERIC